MGEAKRKREHMTPVERIAEELTRKLSDEGLLVRAGFVGFMTACFPNGCPDDQRQELENAFMAGALHLLTSIMNFLDPGEDITDRDMRRMNLIDKELRDFGETVEARVAMNTKTAGNA